MADTSSFADGIGTRPTYDYAPPDAFFASGTPIGGDVYNILDYGAVADPTIDSRAAIQSAIDAAHAAGGGIVYVPPGTFGVGAHPTDEGSVQVLGNVFLKGAGMGTSSLRLLDGTTDDVTGIVRSPWGEETDNWGIADFTIDGNQANTSGTVDGFFTGPEPGNTISDSDVYVTRVEITEVSRYGFDPHELTERLSITDSVAHNNGVDGFVLDMIVEGEFSGNESYENGRHGFNVVTTSNDLALTDNVAHDNGGAGFVVQRGSENIEAPSDIVIQGGASYGNGLEGVLLQMAEDVLVTGMEIHGNGSSGVRLYGAKNASIVENDIHDNSQSTHDGYSEVEIENYVDGVYFKTHEAAGNTVSDNTIFSQGPVQSRYGIEGVDGVDWFANSINAGDEITGTARGGFSAPVSDTHQMVAGSSLDDTVVGTAKADDIYGYGGNDTIFGKDGNDRVFAGEGNDTAKGGKGSDYLEGDAGDDLLEGGSGDDTLNGGAGNDTVKGGSGNDILVDGAGADSATGGSGNDVFGVFDDAANDFFNGGSGTDLLDLQSSSVGLDINASTKVVTGLGVDTFKSIERITGTRHDDTYRGNDKVDTFDAGDGNDVIRGAGGADILTGGAGDNTYAYVARDILDGNDVHRGVDRITDFNLGDVIDVSDITRGDASMVQVADTVDGLVVRAKIDGAFHDLALLEGVHDVGSVSFALGSNVQTGDAGDNKLIGASGNDELHGADGNDRLEGRDGIDKLFGEAGDDTLIGGRGNDVLNGGAGDDDMRGGADNDGFFGGGGNDIIDGGSGNDGIFGDGGDDTIKGGSGNDTAYGGSGHDSMSGGSNDDVLFGQAGNDILNGNSGHDTLNGGADNDQLFGNKGDDTLDGGDGDDLISGGSGNDTIFASLGLDNIDGDGGTDTLDFSNIGAGVHINASTKVASGPLDTNFDSIEKFVGSSFDDTFRGTDGVNTFSGGNGSDTIRSAGGADFLEGGDGDDVFVFFARDVVDSGGQGRGTDAILDYQVGDVIDVRDIAKGDAANVSLSVQDGNVTVSVAIDGASHDVAVLEGVDDTANVSVLVGDDLFA